MSVESARALCQRLSTDEAFRKQLEDTSAEERYKILQAAGYELTQEEWKTVCNEMNEQELEAIAGGNFMGQFSIPMTPYNPAAQSPVLTIDPSITADL